MSDRAILPLTIISRADVTRILRELESYDEILHQDSLRANATATNIAYLSDGLRDIADYYQYELTEKLDRHQLLEKLEILKIHAPQIHISFASHPSYNVLTQITNWARNTLDGELLIQTSISPLLIGGCIVRTSNREFDFSFARKLQSVKVNKEAMV